MARKIQLFQTTAAGATFGNNVAQLQNACDAFFKGQPFDIHSSNLTTSILTSPNGTQEAFILLAVLYDAP